jgi:ABC-type transport system involved in cytochrome c biogenesis permease subunit
MRAIPVPALAAIALAICAGLAPARGQASGAATSEQAAAPAERSAARAWPAWPERVLELAPSLPIQDGGRVKPLSTFASFSLLRMAGRRSADAADGRRLDATEWLLDALFRPELAITHRTFLVVGHEVAEAIELETAGRRERDRYSYEELLPCLPRLFELAHAYDAIPRAERSQVQGQIVDLAEGVQGFLGITRLKTVALVPPIAEPPIAESSAPDALDPTSAGATWETPVEFFGELFGRAERAGGLAPAHRRLADAFESLYGADGDVEAFRRAFEDFHATSVELARAVGAYDWIELEVRYYELRPLTWSLALFVAALLGAACMGLWPRSALVYRGTAALVTLAALLVAVAIAVRCTIRGRPPVSTLYETVLFVSAVGSLAALVIERIERQRVALAAAAILGCAGLFVANGFETLDKQDTMPSLVAVLDTNFWLATHVTAITIGYSAGMLAALLASLYVIARAARLGRGSSPFLSRLARMVYGVLCFGLIFSTVGTILGGIWANESWGRFWGWDPKENGALLIVISQITILHARLSGILREAGLCLAAAFGGTVVAFSWWGVNLLGVGLHSYGFTSGVHSALWTYYAVQWGLVGVGLLTLAAERARARGSAAAVAQEAAAPARKCVA